MMDQEIVEMIARRSADSAKTLAAAASRIEELEYALRFCFGALAMADTGGTDGAYDLGPAIDVACKALSLEGGIDWAGIEALNAKLSNKGGGDE